MEIVGYDLKYTLRNVLSEFELMPTEWPDVLPLVQYIINHRPRPALGDRCPIHVMTGREPDMALDLALWTGVRLKHADVIDAGVERIEQYMDKLVQSVDQMHEEIVDAELQRARKQAAEQAQSRHAHRFELGDLVMVTVADTSLQPSNTDKTKMRWQGPCQVVAIPTPTELHVRMVGYDDSVEPKEVHWSRCRRFAGKDFLLTPAIIQSA